MKHGAAARKELLPLVLFRIFCYDEEDFSFSVFILKMQSDFISVF